MSTENGVTTTGLRAGITLQGVPLNKRGNGATPGGEFAEAVTDSVVDGVVGFDLNLRITLWNRNMELHYNIPRDKAMGRPLNEIIPEISHPNVVDEVLSGKNYFLKDSPFQNRTGFFQAYISPVRNGERIVGGIAIIHDNTEIKQALDKIRKQNEDLIKTNEELRKEIAIRKSAQDELKVAHDELEERVKVRTAQLSAINEELNEFAYVISHDLKAPLRGISSLSDWIVSDYSHKLDSNGRETLDLLKNSVKRMDHMVKGILNYYRMSKPADPCKVDTEEMVREIILQLNPPPTLEIKTSGLPVVVTEEVPLYQVFQNLIDNAIKYNDKGKGVVAVDCRPLGGFWEFSVADNGKGVNKGDLDRIFMLFQTAGGNENNTDSTGIGLAVVKKIINRLGGKIWVESNYGEGSSFHFTLPKTSI